MRLMAVLLMLLVFSAAADLDIWTLEQVESSIPLGSDLNLQLVIMKHFIGWGYYTDLVLVITPDAVIPDSFCINEGVLVSHLDYSSALVIEGSLQILSQGPTAEIDTSRSDLPDRLVLNLIREPFQMEQETTGTCWTLTDGSYVNPVIFVR